jgi:hypothetical protein
MTIGPRKSGNDASAGFNGPANGANFDVGR